MAAALFGLALAAMAVGFAVPLAEAVPIYGRVNPDYSAWQARQEFRRVREELRRSQRPALRLSALSAGPERVVEGDIPSPTVWSEDDFAVYYEDEGKVPQDKFDPRDVEKYRQLPLPRLQGEYGTCWAHAAVGAMEMWLAEKRGDATRISVRHMINRNGRREAGKDWGTDAYAWNNTAWRPAGETYQAAIGYLLSWAGPVREEQDPYWTDDGCVNLGWDSPLCDPCYHVQQVRIFPKLSPADTWTVQKLIAVKRAILEFGGIYVSMVERPDCLDKVTGAYYCRTGGSGHAVTLVGWDDGYSRTNFLAVDGQRPNQDGAFLVRDSSGIGPQDGYLWISYADKFFLRKNDGIAFPYLEQTTNYESVYQYDPLGLVCFWQPNTSGNTCWGANMFAAADDKPITAVGVYVASANERVEISVYAGCDKNAPTSGKLSAGPFNLADFIQCRYAGYYTVRLPEPVAVRAGELFSVVVKMTGTGATYPVECKSTADAYRTDDAEAQRGQSFFSTNADGVNINWRDLTLDREAASHVIPDKAGYIGDTGNFCCKAYAGGTSGEPRKLDSVAIEGVGDERHTPTRTVKPGGTARYVCTAKYDNGTTHDATQEARWSIVSGGGIAEMTGKGGVRISPDVTEPSVVTVKVTYAENGAERSETRQIRVVVAPPSAPSGVVASQGTSDRYVKVSWDRAEDAERYLVYRRSRNDDSAELFPCGETASTSFFDMEVPYCAEDYWYCVRAKNASSDFQTSKSSAWVSGWRSYPSVTGVKASKGDYPNKVEVQWRHVTDSDCHRTPCYRVLRSDSEDGEFKPVSKWLEGYVGLADETVRPDTPYFYAVQVARDANGDRASELSVLSEDCIGYAVTFPTDINLDGPKTVRSAEKKTTIHYGGQLVYPGGRTRSSEEVGAFTFMIENRDGLDVAMAEDGTMTVGALTGKRAANVSIRLTYTGKYSKAMGRNSSRTFEVRILPVLPSAPSELQAQATTEAVTLEWKACDDALSYVVSRAAGSSDAGYEVVANVPAGEAGTLSFRDGDTLPGSLVHYRVCSSNETGLGVWSEAVQARRRLAAPTGVEATTNDATCVTVTWQPVDGATHYLVYRQGEDDAEPKRLGDVLQPGTTYKDLESDVGAGYRYSVRAAVDAEGTADSERSEPAWGRRMPTYETSLEIVGPSRVSCGERVDYRCLVTYSDGHSVEVHEPQVKLKLSEGGTAPVGLEFYRHDLSESGDSAWTFDATRVSLATNVEVWLDAVLNNGTNAVVSRMTANRRITLLEPDAVKAEVDVEDFKVTSRWPFGDELDVDFKLKTDTLVEATLTGYDEDRGVVRPAHTVVGSGADGAGLTDGVHRLTWNVANDYPGLTVNALRVELSTQPVYLGTVTDLRATDGRYATGVRLGWTCSEEADFYVVWRRPARGDGEWKEIARARERAYVDMDAEPDKPFLYCVEAVSAKRVRGPKSDVATGSRKAGSPLYLVLDFSLKPDPKEDDGTGLVPMVELDEKPAGGWTSTYKRDKLVLRRIANGSFWMGTPTNEVGRYDNEDLHRVTLTRPFYLAVFELTREQFYRITRNEADRPEKDSWGEYPRDGLSYDAVYGASTDGRNFLRVFRARTGLSMDLPSEAQWEYACRAGTATAFNIGVDMVEGQTEIRELGIPKTNAFRKVGSPEVQANAWGLCDMNGNQWEWCLDWYHRHLGFDEQVDPVMNEPAVDKGRVARGGWAKIIRECRSACRGNSPSYNRYGIRPCCPAPAQAQTAVTLVDLEGQERRYETGLGGSFAIPAVPDAARAAGFAAWVGDGGGARYGDGATIPCVERETVLRARTEEVLK